MDSIYGAKTYSAHPRYTYSLSSLQRLLLMEIDYFPLVAATRYYYKMSTSANETVSRPDSAQIILRIGVASRIERPVILIPNSKDYVNYIFDIAHTLSQLFIPLVYLYELKIINSFIILTIINQVINSTFVNEEFEIKQISGKYCKLRRT